MKRMMNSATAVAGLMARDTNALRVKITAFPDQYSKKEAAPDPAAMADTIEKLGTAFEAFKSKNDERLEQIERKGEADVVTREELKRIEDNLLDLKKLRDDLDKLAKRASRPGLIDPNGQKETEEQREHREAFIKFIRSHDDFEAKSRMKELEAKAVTGTTDTGGGYAVPETIAREIQRELSEAVDLLGMVHTITAGTKDYKELVDRRGKTYGWAGEGQARNESDTPDLEQVEPTFGTLYAYPTATEESMQDIFFNVESWLVESIAEAHAEGIENAIVNGNGTNKPTGFLSGTPTTDADGARAFGTLEYLPSGAAAALNDPDVLINVVQRLKKGYRRNASWLMNRASVGTVMKLKNGDGDYMWAMGDIKNNIPDRLLGYPVGESEEMPDIAADAFPVAFGDFKAGYLAVILAGLRITRDEITQPGFIKWYARRRLGGQIRKDEAIKLLKIEA